MKKNISESKTNFKNPRHNIPDSKKLPNYMAVASIAPAILAVMAYELVNYLIHLIRGTVYSYNPIDGIAILVPMALFMELFNFFFSMNLERKLNKLTEGIKAVSEGDFTKRLDADKLAPFTDVAKDFNKMAEDLSGVETFRSDFIKDFSHEFKTPIVSIKGFADLLLEGGLTGEEQREYLSIIAEESGRLSHLSEQTLLMSKLDSQTIITDKTEYDLAEQIRQNIILLSPQWEAKKLNPDITLESMKFYGNKDLTSHIWINIVNNAIKFTPEGGRIKVTGKKIGDDLTVQIEDNGIGMNPEELKNVFIRFYQGDSSHRAAGLGLGLSIAKKIALLSGGDIVASSTKGVGTVFTVTLPVAKNNL